MRITISHGAYNHRRYSRPWIAKVTAWPVGAQPELAWGAFLGDDMGGETEIEAHPGDIIRSGQKDNRNPRKSDNNWYIVADDGTLIDATASTARTAWAKRNEETRA